MQSIRRLVMAVVSLAVLGSGGGVGAVAWGQNGGMRDVDRFVDLANEETRLVPGNEALEGVLFPAVLAMEACPVPHRSRAFLRYVGLIDPGTRLWERGVSWVEGEPQQAALEALAEVTDPDARVMLTLPIGTAGVDPGWVDAGLVVELGPKGLLTGLDPAYLRALRPLHAAALLDAKRLIADGEAEAGLMRMVDVMRLYRLVRARPTLEEQLESQELMALAAEQLRDLVWFFERSGRLSSAALQAAVEALDEDVLNLERMRFPSVPRIAAEQLFSRTYVRRQGVDAEEFALALSRIRATEGSPLKLFNEAARYRYEAGRQADWFEVDEMIRDVFGNYEMRWAWDINDEDLAKVPSAHDTMPAGRYRVIDAAAEGMKKLVPYRRALLVHMAGTRLSLATVSYRLARDGDMPRILPNLQPRFIGDIDDNLDYFGYDYDSQRNADFLYFVPGSEEAKPANIAARDAFLYEQPHALSIAYVSPIEGVLGAAVRGSIDFTERARERAEDVEFVAGEPATFHAQWFTLDEDGNRPGTSIEGNPAPPLTFVTARAEELNVQERRGEIVVVVTGEGEESSTGGGTYNPENLATLSRIGLRYHFDGVRVVLVAADYEDESLSEAELRIFGARAARGVGVFDMRFFDEDGGMDDRWSLDRDSANTFLVDRNGIVRAAGVRFRHLEEALLELLDEQPVDPLIPDRAGEGVSPAPLVFSSEVGQDNFVLYSRGMNMRDDREFLQPHVIDWTGRELLFWPPVLSLQREAAN